MQHPDLMIMIAESKRIEQCRRPQLPPDRHPSPLSTLRAHTGNALIALGTRIIPAPRQSSRTAPAAPAPSS
jgi:hypothetical protein